jgi:hypothetical protein
MRFEVIAAFALGILLPVLETARRGLSHWTIDFTTMFEDYLGGALLLIAAWAAYRRRTWATIFVVLAWGAISGVMTISFVSQLEDTIRQTAVEPHNALVVGVKFLLWLTCVTALVLSFRSAMKARPS